MKKLLIASAIALASATGAYAQGAPPAGSHPDATSPQTTGAIPQARMEVIRNYWHTERPRAVVLPQGVVISRGAVVPSTVELGTFPETVGTNHRYIIVGDTMYLVDPASRRVIQVIE